MAYSRLLLLLLIGVICTQLIPAHTKPLDFWCKNDTRRRMMQMIEDKTGCGLDALPSAVHLPCVGIHAAEWKNSTLQLKRAELLEALQMFLTGVQSIRSLVTVRCQTSMLKKLEHSVTNHLFIVDNLHIQEEDWTLHHSVVRNCSSKATLDSMLTEYRRLLSGKLERLAMDLQDSICKERQDN